MNDNNTKRSLWNDYRERNIYMITLVVDGRKPLLGELVNDCDSAYVELSPLGQKVQQDWEQLSNYYPQISVIACQVMPDHLHGIIYIHRHLPVHLGQVIAGFKYGTTKAWQNMFSPAAQRPAASPVKPPGTAAECPPVQPARKQRLWSPGYHDRILRGKDQLQRMIDYVKDNPRRLAIKRAHPDLFRLQESIPIGNSHVAIMGNRFLLDWPVKVQVQCSRHLTFDEIEAQSRHFLALAQEGAVLVSPAISAGEKAALRAAFEAGCPIILLRENGFAPLAKPGGKLFEACAKGKLLLVAPWEHHSAKRTITRNQCKQLNDLAKTICATAPAAAEPLPTQHSAIPAAQRPAASPAKPPGTTVGCSPVQPARKGAIVLSNKRE